MDFEWVVKYATEFLGTAILIVLGNGAVANVELKGTKGHQSGWLVIAVGYGMGVMIPALMFGNVSGNHINPAFYFGTGCQRLFPLGTGCAIHCSADFGSYLWTGFGRCDPPSLLFGNRKS